MHEIERIASSNSDFQEAFETYIQQYGRTKIKLAEPTDLHGSIAPVALILGRNCIVTYNDSTKQLRGDVGSVKVSPKEFYVLGRREPQDAKLVAWNRSCGTELQEYNSLVDTIPSRVHGILANLDDGGRTIYADLGSSAGSILVGESQNLGGAFVRIYDPGTGSSDSIKLRRIITSNKQ
jgi:hypothetical protein